MTGDSNSNDFSQPPQPNRSSNLRIWIAAGSGCGCLGLMILAAITLLSFLNQPQKGKLMEAQQYVSSILRSQQAYRLEKPTFSNSLQELEVGIKPETTYYSYKIVPQPDRSKSVMITAKSKNSYMKSYTGVVFVFKKGADMTTVTAICETNLSSSIPPTMPAPPKDENSRIKCPPGSEMLRF